VDRAYNHGTAVEQRFPLMQDWADWVDGISYHEGTIVPFRQKGAA
jgi:hypothetical protein